LQQHETGWAGISYIDYLRSTWLEKNRDHQPNNQVTNNLESFNALLKRKYIPQWSNSGNRLRLNIFIHYLILKILPEVFAQRRIYGAGQL